MINCPKCGTYVAENEKFCPACGTQIIAEAPAEAVNTAVQPTAAAAPETEPAAPLSSDQPAPASAQQMFDQPAPAPAQQMFNQPVQNAGPMPSQPQPPFNQQPVFQQPGYQQPPYQQPGYQQPPYQQTPAYMNNFDRVVSVGDWMLTLFLIAIPVVNLILLFIWAFGSDAPESKSNFAKAQLIWMLIAIVLSIVISIFFSTLIINLTHALS